MTSSSRACTRSTRVRPPRTIGQGGLHPMGVRYLMRIHTEGVCVLRRGAKDSRVVFELTRDRAAVLARGGVVGVDQHSALRAHACGQVWPRARSRGARGKRGGGDARTAGAASLLG